MHVRENLTMENMHVPLLMQIRGQIFHKSYARFAIILAKEGVWDLP